MLLASQSWSIALLVLLLFKNARRAFFVIARRNKEAEMSAPRRAPPSANEAKRE